MQEESDIFRRKDVVIMLAAVEFQTQLDDAVDQQAMGLQKISPLAGESRIRARVEARERVRIEGNPMRDDKLWPQEPGHDGVRVFARGGLRREQPGAVEQVETAVQPHVALNVR